MSLCRICAQIATVFLWRTTFGGSQLERSTADGGAQFCGEKYEWRAANRLLVVVSQTKVFKAHAVQQGLCENLINTLKLLTNQQRDGDSPMQSIVTGLCGGPEKLY